jgi:hypothetical protein
VALGDGCIEEELEQYGDIKPIILDKEMQHGRHDEQMEFRCGEVVQLKVCTFQLVVFDSTLMELVLEKCI